MKATLLIGFILVSNGSCSDNGRVELKANFETMESCYTALKNASIPDNAVAVCVENHE